MNIKLWYLYRDGANYKKHNSIIFSNSDNLKVLFIEQQIRELLVDGEWFLAKKWELSHLHFEDWDDEIDHCFHEFDCVEETNELNEQGDVRDFLARIQCPSTGSG